MAVSVGTKYEWDIKRKFDNTRYIMDNFYCVPKRYVIDEQELVSRLKKMKPKV